MRAACRLVAVMVLLGAVPDVAVALDDASTASASRLYEGAYLAPMGSYIFNQKDGNAFDNGYGGTFAAGYRNGWWAVEASGVADKEKGKGGGRNTGVVGGTINGLVFPFKGLPGFFGLIGAGGLDVNHHPVIDKEYSLTTAEAGVGYLVPLSMGRYDFGIRADARYRYGKREKRVEPDGDFHIPNDFTDVLLNLGLQLPLGLRPEAPPPAAAPEVAVVPPVAPPPACSDQQDNDGDGKTDFPADPGCTSADDNDEMDPPQCADGKDNDGDGLVDFPADKGCSAADDNDETDACKTPAVGERMSLKGCGTGDVIILRGVNFEFDQSRLTANAKTILDNVAEELAAYPDIKVELGGHTDSKGSDEYNQKLSERRARAVRQYLIDKGVAADRMTAQGYGETRPIADNDADEGREQNRRTELKITAGVAGASTADPVTTQEAEKSATTEPAGEPPSP